MITSSIKARMQEIMDQVAEDITQVLKDSGTLE